MSTTVLLYSKNSKVCNQLFQMMDLSGLNLNSLLSLILICVDDADVRDIILSSDKVKVEGVPCILIVSDHTIQTFEGIDAFNWMEEIIAIFNEKNQPQNEPPHTIIEETPPSFVNTSTIERQPLFPPKQAGIRSDAGNFELGNFKNSEIGDTSQIITSGIQKKSLSVSAMAEALQKERDNI